jgi:hypothetical protein
MHTARTLGRRDLLKLATGAPLARMLTGWAKAAPRASLDTERVALSMPAPGRTTLVRSQTYRVHARVVLLSVPIFYKTDVGGGLALVEQNGAAQERATALQFCAGSWPDRLKGFNRFGLAQEVVRDDRARILESAYLSFMTTSAEKNFSEARSAFQNSAAGLTFSVAHGHSTPGASESKIDRLPVAGHFDWKRSSQVVDEFRGRLTPSVPAPHCGGQGASATFLYAVHRAMQSPAAELEQPFLHLSKAYTLSTKKKSGQLAGVIREPESGSRSEFRLWLDPADPGAPPLRIEFRAKSYLHLIFEAAPPSVESAVRPMLRQEGV